MKKQIPVIDSEKCIQCEKCIVICSNGAILNLFSFACSKCIKYCFSMEVTCTPNRFVFCYEQCDSCGFCIDECEQRAIYWYHIET